ncbi:cell division cycle and apoptosis regulator protein 1-like [Anopheles bellator]|uniref:cell division cycle and apoptosis regulator protein 1-like n=1 Tax=Anopheles bellator TaxID=139047 RepID=UPI0026491A81|nr:cell division cycle and apoptosis regulator protein 1-like [Anopheles bellator]
MGLQQQQNRFMQPPMGFPQWQINSPTVQYPAADTMGAIRPLSQLALSPVNEKATKLDPSNCLHTGIGTVTRTDNNWGFVDEKVFFHQGVCDNGILPKVGDRVLVDADSNHSNRHFKWSASRVHILYPTNTNSTVNAGAGRSHEGPTSNPMVSVSPTVENRSRNRYSPTHKSPDRQAHRGRVLRDSSGQQRERSYERREKERSPPRKRARSVPRYMVRVPKHPLTMKSVDVLEVCHRYRKLYIPSNFFISDIRWPESFPAGASFSLRNPCPFHIMPKGVDSPEAQLGHVPADLDPADADYLYSAKVMLLSTPQAAEFYEKCSAKAEDHDGAETDYVHPTQLIRFLVGTRGNKETMAIGGPWSPSLDGLDPHSDPSVLIRTAIRTCKAMTGIDLSVCTFWCRFIELYYHRSETLHKGHLIPPRVETVVIFLPDVHSCQPTLSDWELTRLCYKTEMAHITNRSSSVDGEPAETNPGIVERKTQQDATADQVQSPAASEATSSTTTVAVIPMDLNTAEDADAGATISGKFDCSVVSLSVLLDYRPEDTKECFFEVSLFAELFNDMLARDFGFTIYKELCLLDGSTDGTISSKSNGNDPQTRSNVRKRSARHSDKDRSQRELATAAYVKPDLMLSFLYFDVTRCGYILEKDVEDIICALGLYLPRSQIHKIVAKATVGDTLQYRRLTEQTTGETESDRKKLQHDASGTAIDAAETDPPDGAEKATSDTIVTELACGNTNYRMQLKQSLDRIANELGGEKQRQPGQNSTDFETANNEGAPAIQGGFVEYRGGFIDVAKLLQQLKRTNESLANTEKRLQVARTQTTELTATKNRVNRKVKELVAETKSLSKLLFIDRTMNDGHTTLTDDMMDS